MCTRDAGRSVGGIEDAELDREALAESVIQRFKTCFDCLWKVLNRHLRYEGKIS